MTIRTSVTTAAFTLLLSATAGCSEPASSGDSANADAHRVVLATVADKVVIPLTETFVAETSDLQAATSTLVGAPTPENLASAQARWRSTMAVWQQLELLQVGPAGLMGTVAGGDSLRDAIYSWPTVNTCRVDQESARRGFLNLSAALVNVRGLDALEHLLFTTSTDHTCSAGSEFASSGEWAAIGDASAVALRRAEHADAVAADLAASAQTLRDAWSPLTAGTFRDVFANAGQNTAVYGTAQEALNALSDAMFYLEKETKDMKLAIPAGVTQCDATTCPEDREHPAASVSKASIISNIDGFRRIFTGGLPGEDNPSFDDLLSSMGQEALATRLVAELDAARDAIEALPGTLLEAVNNAPDKVVAAYEVLRVPIQTFRTEVLSVLDLELPQRAEGDND